MKKLVLAIYLFWLSLVVFSQYGQEIDKLMGIEPIDENQGCLYVPIETIFDSVCCFVSHDGIVAFNGNVSTIPNVSFLFNQTTIMVSGLKSYDPKKMINVLGEIDRNETVINNQAISYVRYQSKDNSGSNMVTVIGVNQTTKETNVSFIYKNSAYNYVTTQGVVPEKPFNILDDIDTWGYLYDGSYSNSYLDSEVREFLSQFGNPDIILSFMVANIFYKKHPLSDRFSK